jgi:hypothetical protein
MASAAQAAAAFNLPHAHSGYTHESKVRYIWNQWQENDVGPWLRMVAL